MLRAETVTLIEQPKTLLAFDLDANNNYASLDTSVCVNNSYNVHRQEHKKRVIKGTAYQSDGTAL